MRPYGVWAVISPFNFPMALSAGPIGAALVAGNTVVLKPSEQGVFTGLMTCQALWEAGVPAGALHVVTGPGETVGHALVDEPRRRRHHVHRLVRGRHGDLPHLHPGPPEADDLRDGRQEPGDREPPRRPRRRRGRAPRARRSGSAGRSAPPHRARTSSARSLAEFVAKLVAQAEALTVGDPLARDTYMGPVVDEAAVDALRARGRGSARSGARCTAAASA